MNNFKEQKIDEFMNANRSMKARYATLLEEVEYLKALYFLIYRKEIDELFEDDKILFTTSDKTELINAVNE